MGYYLPRENPKGLNGGVRSLAERSGAAEVETWYMVSWCNVIKDEQGFFSKGVLSVTVL